MLINSRLAASWVKTMFMSVYEPGYANYNNYTCTPAGLWLCVGSVPTDSEVAAMSGSDNTPRIMNCVAVKYGASVLNLVDANAIPPVFTLTLPATKAVAATRTGTISWAAIFTGAPPNYDASGSVGTSGRSYLGAVADVSVTGGTGAVTVDRLDIPAVGAIITLTGFSFPAWRK